MSKRRARMFEELICPFSEINEDVSCEHDSPQTNRNPVFPGTDGKGLALTLMNGT
ncbi:MAG: hypothetical protein GY835_01470 [bacterium]|nr:hypothetical protein [bacterium]